MARQRSFKILETAWQRLAGLKKITPNRMKRVFCGGSLLLGLLLTSACSSETLFRSNFDANAVNQPPAQAQEIGTAKVAGPAGSVVVVPAPGSLSGKWIRVSRTNEQDIPAFQGNLSTFRGDGTYVFSTTLFIPSGTGLASIQFEPFGQPVGNSFNGFLHLDFMQNNRVRIDDDDSTIFGTFQRDQPFILQVTLTINASSPKATIVLAGATASGQAERIVSPIWRQRAQQFGAVRIWMGFPWTGPFYATNVAVTRNT